MIRQVGVGYFIKQVFVLYSVILCTMYNPLVPELEQGHAGINFICSNSKATQRTDSAVFTVKYLHRDKKTKSSY